MIVKNGVTPFKRVSAKVFAKCLRKKFAIILLKAF